MTHSTSNLEPKKFPEQLQVPENSEDEPAEPGGLVPPKPLMRGWIHFGAFFATLLAGPFLITAAHNAAQRVALIIYILSLLGLFGVSASFHRITWQSTGRRRMRRADHSTIFIAIAGSYTAVSVLALDGWRRVLLLSLVWAGAAIGIALRQIWLDAPKPVVAIPYVVVGWSALVVLPQLIHSLGGVGFGLLLGGGAVYTAGAIVYSIKKPDPWPKVFGYHEIFHTCTVIGATLHFVVISFYALPRS